MRHRADLWRAQTRWGDELRHQEAPQRRLPVMPQGPQETLGLWAAGLEGLILVCGGGVCKGFLAERLMGKLTRVLKVGEGSFFGWVEFSVGQDGGPWTRGVQAEGLAREGPGGWKMQRIFEEHPLVGDSVSQQCLWPGPASSSSSLLKVPPPPLLPHLLGTCSSSVILGALRETEILLPPLTELEGPMPGALQALCATPHSLSRILEWTWHGDHNPVLGGGGFISSSGFKSHPLKIKAPSSSPSCSAEGPLLAGLRCPG